MEDKMIKKILFFSLLFLFLKGEFFESHIPLPEGTSGIYDLWILLYNPTNDKLYLLGASGDFAILDGETLDTIDLTSIYPASFPPAFPHFHYLPQTNKVYLGVRLDTSPYLSSQKYGYIIFDGETNRIIDTILVQICAEGQDIVL